MLLLAAVMVGAFAALPVGSASAGRLLVTGHDQDFHCAGNEGCGFVEVATRYARSGAPDPSKPVLVLDREDNDFARALDNAFGAGAVPRTVIDPRSEAFRSVSLSTSRFSAILVASDTTCGGCDLNESDSTPDSDAINSRKADIERFFNEGGGIYANAGANHGDGNPDNGADVFYDFLPLPATGIQVEDPFCLTADGRALGFQDQGCPDESKRTGTRDDINCCPTHNSFAEPAAGSRLRVAERDNKGAPETLFGEGRISGGRLVAGEEEDPSISVRGLPSSCASRDFSMSVTVTDDSALRSARVRVDGVTVRSTTKKSFKAVVRARGMRPGTHTIRVTATDAAGNSAARNLTFRRCARRAQSPRFTG